PPVRSSPPRRGLPSAASTRSRGTPTMTTSAADRAEISRQNGRKSTGPKTREGKDRSKFNAVKHGLRAKLPVLPGEDAQIYEGRLEAWIAGLQPRNEVEHG